MPQTLNKLTTMNLVAGADGKTLAIELGSASGDTLRFGVDGAGLNILVSTLIEAMVKLGERTAPPEGEHLVTTRIIDAAAISTAPGRSPSEVYLNIEVGPSSFVFALPARDVVNAVGKMDVSHLSTPTH